MKALIDGFLSFLAAIATAFICGVPAWFTFQAVQTGLAPMWVYAAVAALAGVGLLMTYTFIEKGFRGVSPSRDRRRPS
ncbi:hypothetical protein [Yoonia sp. 208BN28-4]|uniref:hypothetical protein n=1 Tax=Yoonia sp. 208BN28-4 TaxID=3126505 RepID=UPI0030A7FBD9